MVGGSNTKLKVAAYLLIVVHLLLVVLHAVAHQMLEVNPTPVQLSFIVAVIMSAPVIAGVLLRKYEKSGAVLLAMSMFGAFLFGVYNHFVGHSIDHVAEVAHLQPRIWSTIFQSTAVGLATSEAAGSLLGIWLLSVRQTKLETHAA